MARRSILAEDETVGIDMSPMIDCIFILLIFFIVTTVFVDEQGIQVDKPDAAATAMNEEADDIAIEITENNQILLDDTEVPLQQVAERVRAKLGDATSLTIRAHSKSKHGVFTSVWDAARSGGAHLLSFSTVD